MSDLVNTLAACRHVIWDWNGTLFDDGELVQDAVNQQLIRLGLPTLDPETYSKIFSHPVQAFYERVGVNFEKVSFDSISSGFHADYGQRRWGCRVRAEALVILKYFSDRGISQSILSAYEQKLLEEIVTEKGIRNFFEAVVGLEDLFGKSKLERGQSYIKSRGLEKCRLLLIGDTDHDAEVAEALGADCILIPSGYQHIDILRRSRAFVCTSFEELCAAIPASGSESNYSI